MTSGGKKKTTWAKRDRENRLRERRAAKRAKKDARKLASQDPDTPPEPEENDHLEEGVGGPTIDDIGRDLADA